ncbi:MAG TPA: peptidoglycan DD-metalloendopeptidase family protein [Aquabacterium sp.]|uniref:M23 family metallopeptidase n=1 Tax=Aquabacterium sp. TaxID=1872578 RepID=UPI002E311A4F|nr:peptidoglycan DD-metalloendopeptidase family protein [Aquabacterium sp.]HEX5371114.1 peptidoglycan DD-metalloendopeptidase family protein [Aquabacterium sp.]
MNEHPRRVTAVVVALLAGSTMTAFGVAPLTAQIDNGPLPVVTTIDVALPLPQLGAQLEALDREPLTLYRSDVTRQSDTIDSLLRRLGVDDDEAARFIRSDAVASTLMSGRSGKMIKVMTDNGRLVELIARGPAADSEQIDSHFTRLTIRRAGDQIQGALSAHTEQAPLQVREQVSAGTIQSSLYAAADDAGVPDAITNQIAEIFSADIDFRRELRKGDAFSVVYEGHTADGEPITWGGSAGKVLAARFINKGVAHDAVWFEEPGRKGAYFDLTGRSKIKSFLASPLAFSRVTSGFAMRFHPIQLRWKAHLGVDYGAPTGTPVRSVGDGVVTFAGVQNGYGNVVQVTHSGDRVTVYAHLHKIMVQRGQKLEQGMTLGTVGSTGWATGPHLHFEFKVGGRHVDPMTIARSSESTQISPLAQARYREHAQITAQRLDMAGQMQVAGAQSGPRFE